MMPPISFLAFDLGAASGRAILGFLEGDHLEIQELHRFSNAMLSVRGRLHWDIRRLFDEIQAGLTVCAQKTHIESLAVDTWGVDFGLLSNDGTVLGLPFTYRDSHTQGAMEEFFEKVPRERIYSLTGIQFLPFNSLFQLHAMKRDRAPEVEEASDLLFMPDLFQYLLTGEKKTEFTFATTTQLFNPKKGAWEGELFKALGIPRSLMQDIVQPGSRVGNLEKSIAANLDWKDVSVVATASHDTASAVAAIPAKGKDWAYISSGTWSLMGIETDGPIIHDMALKLNFTNEGGVKGTFRFLKNITGLWLLQKCSEIWTKGKHEDYGDLMARARDAKPFLFFIDPDWEGFLNPANMPETIQRYCAESGQAVPCTRGEFVRGICESLALKYRSVLDELREIGGAPIRRIHVIGGGAKNRLLCQFTANATEIPVLAGPAEATAIGNILVQSMVSGQAATLGNVREIVRNSFEFERFEPESREDWQDARERFQKILERGMKNGKNPSS